jgi:hypothetical protein
MLLDSIDIRKGITQTILLSRNNSNTHGYLINKMHPGNILSVKRNAPRQPQVYIHVQQQLRKSTRIHM